MNNHIAYCGLNCRTCQAHIATVNDDDAMRAEVAREWSRLNGVEITPAMINCMGCRTDGVKTPYCLSMCPIRLCASEKGYETCADCAAVAVCDKVGMVIGNNAEALSNLKG